MTSRNLFFKLAKEDLKRRVWLAALSVLTFSLPSRWEWPLIWAM